MGGWGVGMRACACVCVCVCVDGWVGGWVGGGCACVCVCVCVCMCVWVGGWVGGGCACVCVCVCVCVYAQSTRTVISGLFVVDNGASADVAVPTPTEPTYKNRSRRRYCCFFRKIAEDMSEDSQLFSYNEPE